MNRARNAILSRVRSSLKAQSGDQERSRAALARIIEHPALLVPERARGAAANNVALLRTFLEGQQAQVLEVPSADAVPEAVAGYLHNMDLGKTVRMGTDPRLLAMPWATEDRLSVLAAGAAEADDRVGLSHALAGVAETGTLVIGAGANNPVTLAFLPATHIIVVARHSIVGSYEDAISLVRDTYGETGMPRTLNYISGPSRTADIGGKIVIGAHGPRNLCVIVTG